MLRTKEDRKSLPLISDVWTKSHSKMVEASFAESIVPPKRPNPCDGVTQKMLVRGAFDDATSEAQKGFRRCKTIN